MTFIKTRPAIMFAKSQINKLMGLKQYKVLSIITIESILENKFLLTKIKKTF